MLEVLDVVPGALDDAVAVRPFRPLVPGLHARDGEGGASDGEEAQVLRRDGLLQVGQGIGMVEPPKLAGDGRPAQLAGASGGGVGPHARQPPQRQGRHQAQEHGEGEDLQGEPRRLAHHSQA